MPGSLRSFTDAAADAVAREIASLRREAQREGELRAAEHAARLALLDARLSSVADLERRLADRLASLKDGEPGRDGRDGADGRDGKDGADGNSITIEDCAPLIGAEVERALSTWERPRDGASVTVDDLAPAVEEAVQRAVAALPVPRDGRDGADGKDGRDGTDGASVGADELAPMIDEMVQRAVAALPLPKDGRDGADGKDGRDGRDGTSVSAHELMPVMEEMVQRVVSELPPPKGGRDGADGRDGRDGVDGNDGQSVTMEEITPVIAEAVQRAVAELPVPRDGVDGKDGRDGADGRDGIDGQEGAPGKLPVVGEWSDRIFYEGDVVIHGGSTYQATRDTAKEPPHADWSCLAKAGADGRDGRTFTIRGTWSEVGEYQALDVVALGGASFAARRDDPGACPGEGWQLIAAQGKRGNPGEKGREGPRGIAGVQIKQMDVDTEGLLTITNDDASQVSCDLYPVLSRLS